MHKSVVSFEKKKNEKDCPAEEIQISRIHMRHSKVSHEYFHEIFPELQKGSFMR